MVSFRSLTKTIAYRAGLMGAYHALHNADTLTVVMFHRVLPPEQIARSKADPHYTVTPRFLADCIRFLRQNYSLVSLEDILSAQATAKPISARAALITFDDGWYDNLKYAAPILDGAPWTVFVAADAMLQPECWWQETLLWALRSHAASIEELWIRGGASIGDLPKTAPGDLYALLWRYGSLEPQRRSVLLAPFEAQLVSSASDPMMLSPTDLTLLRNAGASIGAHGASHVPLSLLPQDTLERELVRSRDLLSECLGGSSVQAMSMPHGQHNEAVLAAAKHSGYRLLFTSAPHLNPRLVGPVVGRIALDMHDLADSRGRLDRGQMAAWLFRRERH